jgi:NAD dependent epimerase/dehydratase family enzyme
LKVACNCFSIETPKFLQATLSILYWQKNPKKIQKKFTKKFQDFFRIKKKLPKIFAGLILSARKNLVVLGQQVLPKKVGF